MVNDSILSLFKDAPPVGWSGSGEREINSGPLYSAEQVALLANSDAIRPSTKDCLNDIQQLELDNDDLARLVKKSLKTGRYINSVWCRVSPKAIAACDAYTVCDKAWIEAARKEMDCQYYLKFAINSSGKLLLMVSCHLSQ